MRNEAAAARGQTSVASSIENRQPPPRSETHFLRNRISDLMFGQVYALWYRPPSLPTGLVFGCFEAVAKEKKRPPIEKPSRRGGRQVSLVDELDGQAAASPPRFGHCRRILTSVDPIDGDSALPHCPIDVRGPTLTVSCHSTYAKSRDATSLGATNRGRMEIMDEPCGNAQRTQFWPLCHDSTCRSTCRIA